MKIILNLIVIPFIFFVAVGWFTGSKEYIFAPNDDERKRSIKQKAIIQSWITVLLFLFSNLVMDLFQLRDARLNEIPLKYPELSYLIVAVVSYFIFYIINSRRMSA
ncbi:hypothetical protein ACFDTO_19015 [Microbacteriaceae bacterium 4G12]